MSTAGQQHKIEDFEFSYGDVAMACLISSSKMDWKWNMTLHEAVQKEATVAGANIWRHIFQDEEIRAYFEGLLCAPAAHQRYWFLPSPMFFAAGVEAKGNREIGQYLLFQEETLHHASPPAPPQPQSPAFFSTQALMACVLLSQQVQPLDPFVGRKFQSYFNSALAVEKLNYSGLFFRPEYSTPELAEKQQSKPEAKASDKAELETIFKGLAKAWKEETVGCSVTTRRYAHSSYQAILVLGPDVVPYMLRELQERPDWWFEALKALTKEDPTKPTDNFNAAVRAWLNWGKEKELLS